MHSPHHPRFTPARLEAFSDGVIAVIITIMVLELKAPQANGIAGLRAVLPTLLIYILSFLFTGIYWVNHHLLMDRVEQIDASFLYSNLFFLFCLSLLPFFTSWVLEKGYDPFSVMLYSISQLVIGTSFLTVRMAVDRRLKEEQHFTEASLSEQRKHWISLLLYVAAIGVARFSPISALLLDAAVTLVWVLPHLGTRRSREARPAGNALQPPNHIS